MSQQKSKQTLLLVEDNDDHAEIIQYYIEEYDPSIEVIRLSDGKSAIDHILEMNSNNKECYPWLILLDIKLPKYDGHEILLRLKSDSTLTKIPVVVFTTSNSSKDIETALKRGANSYIQKPTEPDKFATTIATIIDYWSLNQHGIIIEGLNRHA